MLASKLSQREKKLHHFSFPPFLCVYARLKRHFASLRNSMRSTCLALFASALVPVALLQPATAQVPTIMRIVPQNGVSGDQITISGTSFGAKPGLLVFAGLNANPIQWSDSSITVTVPDNLAPDSVALQVTNSGGKTGAQSTFLLIPRVTGLDLMQAAPGQPINVSGKGFGTVQGSCHVLFGAVEATGVSGWSPSGFKVNVPATLSPGATQISLNCGSIVAGIGNFTVLTGPRLQTPDHTSVAAGDTVNLPGTAFGATPGTVKLDPEKGGSAINASITTWTDTKITFVVPGSDNIAPGGYYIEVTVNGATANLTYLTVLASASPQVQAIVPPAPRPGDQIVIQGSNFGTAPGKVTIGGVDVTPSTAADWTDTSINVVIPASAKAGSASLTVQNSSKVQGNQTFTILNTSSDPQIAFLHPPSAPKGKDLTIQGTNFGSAQGKVLIAGADATPSNAANWTATSITVTVPATPSGVNAGQLEVITKDNKIALAPYTVSSKPLWSDHDERPLDLQMVGGYEEGYQSAQASAGNPFIALYGRRLFHGLGPYFAIRLLEAPAAGNTNNVISVLTNPTGTLTTSSLQQVGSAADVTVGLEVHPKSWQTKSGQTTGDILLGGGFISPTQANSQQAAFTMPAYGTGECTQMQNRNFSDAYANLQKIDPNQYMWGNSSTNATKSTAGACLINTLGFTTSGGTATYAPAAVTTLIYASRDQTSFYPKYQIGARLINRYYTSSTQSTCDRTTPCARGIVDFTIGQNAVITKGGLHGMVFNIEAIHPVPVPTLSFIYLFGALFKTLNGPSAPSYPPLILQPATISSSGLAPNQPPNPATLVVPATLTSRDFYRFGAGISLNQIFTALAPKSNSNPQ